MMIQAYFNLKDVPFKKDIAIKTLFASAGFQEGCKRLDHIKKTRGLFLLTGDPGVGKTTLLRYFHEELNQQAWQLYYIPLATVTVIDFYRQLNHFLGGKVTYRKADLFRQIQDGIRQLVQNRKIVPVFVFDEAHLLKNDNFTELQLILNFDFDSVMPAVVIIAGQSHLRDRLGRDIFASFAQRISLKYHLTPLSKIESINYVQDAIQKVGGNNSLFTENALEALFNNTQGNLRMLGNLATKALLAAATSNKSVVSEEDVFLATTEV